VQGESGRGNLGRLLNKKEEAAATGADKKE